MLPLPVALVKVRLLDETLVEETVATEIKLGREKTSWPVEELTAIWFVVPVAIRAPVRLLREETFAAVEVRYFAPPLS